MKRGEDGEAWSSKLWWVSLSKWTVPGNDVESLKVSAFYRSQGFCFRFDGECCNLLLLSSLKRDDNTATPLYKDLSWRRRKSMLKEEEQEEEEEEEKTVSISQNGICFVVFQSAKLV